MLPADIHRIQLPMPGTSLRSVNTYLVEGQSGHILVDCGWGTPDSRAALDLALSGLRMRLADVREVIVTHHHLDHFGLAGTLQREAGVGIAMHRNDWEWVGEHMGDPPAEMERRHAWLRRNGLDIEDADTQENSESFRERYSGGRATRIFEGDETLVVDGRTLRIIWTPGHTSGHICVFDERSKALMSGDHVLPMISPHVGIWHDDEGDPLSRYLASLEKIAAYDAALVLPSHREPFTDLRGRVAELLDHHHEREEQILAVLAGGTLDGAAIAMQLPWSRGRSTFAQLPPLQRRFALAETLAHLERLRTVGRVKRADDGKHVRYAALSETVATP